MQNPQNPSEKTVSVSALELIEEALQENWHLFRDIESNYDCDEGAHGVHHYACRCCKAKAAMAKTSLAIARLRTLMGKPIS